MTKQDIDVFWRLKLNARIRRFNKNILKAPEGYTPQLDSQMLKAHLETKALNPISEEQRLRLQKRRFMCSTIEKRLQLFDAKSPKVPPDYDPAQDLKKLKNAELHRKFWSLPLEKRVDLYDEGSPLVPEDYYPSDDSLNLLKFTANQKMEQSKSENTAPAPALQSTPKRTFVKVPMVPQMLHDTWYQGDLIPEAAALFGDEFNARVNKPIIFKVLNNKQNQIVLIAGNDQRLIRFVSFEMGYKIISVTSAPCTEQKTKELNAILDRFNKVLEPIKTRKYVMLGEFEA